MSVFTGKFLELAPAGLVARSSGVFEDSERASFAGVYESFLCLSSVGEVWDSISKCWCSAWSPHTIDYALNMGVEPEPDQMVVIVQQVVPLRRMFLLLLS